MNRTHGIYVTSKSKQGVIADHTHTLTKPFFFSVIGKITTVRGSGGQIPLLANWNRPKPLQGSILSQHLFYPGQGGCESGDYPGNTVHEAEHP